VESGSGRSDEGRTGRCGRFRATPVPGYIWYKSHVTGRSQQREDAEAFTAPAQVNQRRYEALRAYFVDGLSYADAGERLGYTRWAMINLVRDYRAGKLELFAPPRRPGPPPGAAPARDRARGRVIALRRQGLSAYEISARLAAEGTPLNRTSVGEILAEEGFGRLLRHPEPEASASPATAGRDTTLPRASVIDFDDWPARTDTGMAGLLLVIPDLIALDLPALVAAAGYPDTRVIPAISWMLSLLALKLTATRRVSHVDDLLIVDPAAALLAGLAILPKKSALTSYSYRLCHDHQRAFLAALDAKMIGAGLAAGEEAIFDLDFHAVMHWGRDPVLEKHYVPTRSQRARSVLTFFAQDSGTHNLVYGNADISKATQAREVIAFCDHWKQVSGTDPKMLVMDQKVTTQPVLGELDARGVKFLTLRMRSPALVNYISRLTSKDFTTISLDRPGPCNRPRVHEDPAVKLTSYPGTVRQLVVTGLGREAPTVIISNDHDTKTRALVEQYARRMTIEQRLAEIIRAFCADALSSTVNLNVDLDIMLAVLAQALLAALRARLPGYAAATPDTLQRRFLDTRGEIITSGDVITVRLSRRTYSPVLRQADLPPATKVPWWGNRTLRYELA
jgi:transposase